MIDIDQSTAFGQRVARRLQDEYTVWLTTTSPDGTPQPRPVWFWWDGETFLIYSQPDTHKLEHVRRSPKVSLHFDSNGQGGDIVVFIGEAEIPDDVPPANEVPEYVEKYAAGISGLGTTPEGFAQDFSVPLRVTPTRLRGH